MHVSYMDRDIVFEHAMYIHKYAYLTFECLCMYCVVCSECTNLHLCSKYIASILYAMHSVQ